MRRVVLAAVAAAAVLAVAALVLALAPARPTAPSTLTGLGTLGPLPPIDVASPLEQPVTATGTVARVVVVPATYGSEGDCSLRATLLGAGDELLAERVLQCRELPDTAEFTLFELDPEVAPTDGDRLRIRLEALPGGDKLVTLWGGRQLQVDQRAVSGTQSVPMAAAVRLDNVVEGRWASLVPTALERLALGAPWWAQPAWMVVWVLAAAAAVVAAVAAAAAGRLRALVVAVAVLALARGLVWAAVLPPGEGMDEPAHFSYAEFVAVEREIPVRGRDYDGLPPYSPQLRAYLLDARVFSLTGFDRREYTTEAQDALEDRVAGQSPRAGGSSPAAGYPVGYYAGAAVAAEAGGGDFLADLYAMRVWSVLLGVAAAALAALGFWVLLPGATGAAGLLAVTVALQPMIGHQFGIVNNDALVIAAGFAAIAVGARVLRAGPRPWLMLLGGLAAGAALLAKPIGAVSIGVVAVAWLLSLRRLDPGRRVRGALLGVLMAVAGAALTYGPWFVAQQVYDWPPVQLAQGGGQDDRSVPTFLALQVTGETVLVQRTWVEQYWGRFAWLDVVYPDRVNTALSIATVVVLGLTLAALAALAARALRGRTRAGAGGSGWAGGVAPQDPPRDGDGHVPVPPVRPGVALLWCLGGLAATTVVLYAAAFWYFRETGRNDLLQGRYALLSLPLVVLLPVLSAWVLAPARAARRVATAAAGGLAVAVLALHSLGLFLVTERFYL